ncbi:protein-(glutamine-N5) methyltransferase, release factor-specific, partial [filamentous cyanobacterium CCP5]
MIDIALDWLEQQPRRERLRQGHWVDLGTGSGAIALALAKALPETRVHAVDLSGEAIALATENARQNGLGDRVTFHQGSWLEPLIDLREQVAAMVSNPPYIPSAIVPTLEPEVANHEPLAALDGGGDGLEAIRILARTAPDYLAPGGLWLVEMMAGQGEAVMNILTAEGCYQGIRIIHDLARRDRFVLATFRTVC